jgi:hypothetical protein
MKTPPKKKPIGKPAAAAVAPIFQVTGKMSTFGGPDDHGVSPTEGLALFEPPDLQDPKYASLFLPAPPPGTSGLARRLNPEKYYLACRWDYSQTPRKFLRDAIAVVFNPENRRSAEARPVDWGPNVDTKRVTDLSPGLAAVLGLNTDDVVRVSISASARAVAAPKIPRMPKGSRPGHGTKNSNPKPVIKEFVESPNHSSRNGTPITMVVLHCTEASLDSTLTHFQTAGGTNPVSAHYVIDGNGDIYQTVGDSDSAWHCMGANKGSIGIEHVATDAEALEQPQAKASAALIRFLLEQYEIPRSNVFGHDFTPGYNRPGGTSCPDKLFGAAHSQATVAAWVEANV